MNTGVAFRRTLDIYPILGMITQIPARDLPLGASPDMMNMCVVSGCLRKRPGFRQWRVGSSAFDSPVQGLASTQDEENVTHLYAFSQTGMYKFNEDTSVWDTCTGPAFTGEEEDMFVWEVSQNQLVASQGVDPVVVTPFSTTYAVLNANCPPARYMTRGADRLILADTYESSARKPFRVRRSVAQDHTDWTGVGSGFTDLAEFPYHIKNIRKIGTRIAVYTEKSIWIGVRTGEAAAPLEWQPIVTESGLFAPYTLKGRRNLHIFVGTDDVYEFNGTGASGVGFAVLDEILQQMNPVQVRRMFAEVLSELQEYLCFITTGGAETPNRVWVYNWALRAWFPWTVSGPQCSTLHRIDGPTTWDDVDEPWDDVPVEWDSIYLARAYPTMLTGHTDNKVYVWNLRYQDDSGAAIPCYWTSKELHAGDVAPEFRGKQITLRSVTVSYKSSGAAMDVEMYYRADGGAWLGPFTESLPALPAGNRSFTVDEQVSGGRVQFRIRHSSATRGLIINSFHPEVEIRDYQAR